MGPPGSSSGSGQPLLLATEQHTPTAGMTGEVQLHNLEERILHLEGLIADREAITSRNPLSRFVHELSSSFKLRALILGSWMLLFCIGAALYTSFPSLLALSIDPPPDSASGIARAAYDSRFPPDPIQLIVMTSVDRPLRYNSTIPELKNQTCGLCLFYPYFPFNHTLNSTVCPLDTHCGFQNATLPPADRAAHVSHDVLSLTRAELDHQQCRYIFLSAYDIKFPLTLPFDIDNTSVTTLVEDVIKQYATDLIFSADRLHTLALVQATECKGQRLTSDCVLRGDSHCAPINSLQSKLEDFASGRSEPGLELSVISMPIVYKTVLDGVNAGMDLSVMLSPLLFVVLFVMLRSVRLLLLGLLNIACGEAAALCVAYPFASTTSVTAFAPAIMLALVLALSIDYSLFLLSRFNEEVRQRPNAAAAIEATLATAGHTIALSGTVLFMVFLAMLLIPTSTLSTVGVCASFSVLFTMLAALSMQPAVLLSAPEFFASNRRWGFTFDDVAFLNARGIGERTASTSFEPLPTQDDTVAQHKADTGDVEGSPSDECSYSQLVSPDDAAIVEPDISTEELPDRNSFSTLESKVSDLSSSLLPGSTEPQLLPEAAAPENADGADPAATNPPVVVDEAAGVVIKGEGAVLSSWTPRSLSSDFEPNVPSSAQEDALSVDKRFWTWVGVWAQRHWLISLTVLLAVALPFGLRLLGSPLGMKPMQYIEGVESMLPRGDHTTQTFIKLQSLFGSGAIFPNTLMIEPPDTASLENPFWLNETCLTLSQMASDVTSSLHERGVAYNMSISDFSGIMIQSGLCIWEITVPLELPLPIVTSLGDGLLSFYGNTERTATKVGLGVLLLLNR